MTLEPRKRLLEDSAARQRHAELFSNPEVQHWITVAFAHYCLHLPPTKGQIDALDSNSRRDGAIEFIHVLLNLSNQLTVKPRVDDNLPHMP